MSVVCKGKKKRWWKKNNNFPSWQCFSIHCIGIIWVGVVEGQKFPSAKPHTAKWSGPAERGRTGPQATAKQRKPYFEASMLRIDFSRRGAFSLQGPSSSFPCPLTSSLLRLHGLSWTPGWRCGPQKERSKKPVAMMMSCTGVSEFSHLHAFIQPCNHPPVFPSGKKKKRSVLQNLTFGIQHPSVQCKCKCKQ